MWQIAAVVVSGIIMWWQWDNIVIALQGKRLAVLGARRTGKTSLLSFLTTGSIPSDYAQTTSTEKVQKIRKKLKELDLKIKKCNDVSGDTAAYAEWKEEFDQADLVLYLLRADKILMGDEGAKKRFEADIYHICTWSKDEANKDKKIFIIGSHCDNDESFKKKPKGDYLDEFNHLEIIEKMKRKLVNECGGGNIKVILGCMDTNENAEKLVMDIFKQVVS